MNGRLLSVALLLSVSMSGAVLADGVEFPGTKPGKAEAQLQGSGLELKNTAIGVVWNLAEGRFRLMEIVDRISMSIISWQSLEAFQVTLADGKSISASQFRVTGKPTLSRLEPQPDSVQRSRRFVGWRAVIPLQSPDGKLGVRWSVTLRDEANYATQQLVLEAKDGPVDVESVTLLDCKVRGAKVSGVVNGSPVVAGNLFFACEHPMASNRVEGERVVCSSRCAAPLKPGEPWTRTSVIGVVPPGQLRRGFLYYVERQRPRPYQLFLHYNSWWDIAWPDRKMNEKQCLEVIDIFGRELVKKRGVPIDSFVFDDGWDDDKTLWHFHSGFPRGFTPLRAAAEKYGSAVGTWLSPWGGYSHAKKARLEYGKTQGFETNSRGFSLAGPKYYQRFRDVCVEMIRKYGVNYFKFDGIAGGINSAGAGDEFSTDVEALLRLTTELRELRPDVYLSITTGTWPSPYWLWYGDSVWRNGHDWNAHGAGSVRQQWITYRDMITRRMIVDRAPLYPINSLMTVSVCYAQLGTATKMASGVDDLVDEIRMAFGGGTQLLELYVTPQMMKPEAWDALAQCTRWSRENRDVLVDVHWIGGDPGKGEPYGYASWSPRKGILVLRNPSESAGSLTLDLATAFELPAGAPKEYALTTRWSKQDRQAKLRLRADQPHAFQLAPFEVRILEAVGN